MPEGPEVKNIVNELSKFLKNKNLNSILIHSGRYSKKYPDNFLEFEKKLPLKILEVKCKGKFIWFQLENKWSIWNTLGMSGGWNLEKSKHSHIEFLVENQSIFFTDVRNFGTFKFCNDESKLNKKLKSLGPDILEKEFNLEIFMKILKKKSLLNKTIPEVFMNQSHISGIGNYLKSEILYKSKISPFRVINSLSIYEIETLFTNIIKIANNSYKSGGATIRNYSNINSEEGTYTFQFKVYQMKKDPLGNIVQKIQTKDRRTTHWVPEIQI
tara:strand:+ start:173 stop:982 length:810 start_codon:yes stop_codon:yes gene_type:complete